MADLIVDASIAAAWCFPDEQTTYTNNLLRNVSSRGEALAPHILAYEIRNTVLMGIRRGQITKPHGDRFLGFLNNMRIRLVEPLSYDAVFVLAEQYGLTVHDASYLDLAIKRGLPLASLDKALTKAAGKSGVALFQPV